jgi:hypothetical protein
MTTTEDLAYLAGIVDGEGYVGIKKSRAYQCQGRVTPGYHARIQVRMVDEPTIAFLGETLGGWCFLERAQTQGRRTLYCYQASDLAAATALERLLPYLRVKRENAETVLALRELQSQGQQHRTKVTGYRDFPNSHGTVRRVANRAYSDEYVAACEALYQKCKALNAGIR